ncbi:MAG TPA: chemotaxis protein CheA [Rikenellaceae bacterium]|nr:chemotaxis protein CheA [Rikenellaceae bacterium]
MIDMHRELFKEEAYELLAELEVSLLELEKRPDDKEIIGRVFRAMHTIKGSGAMFGFDDIAEFSHEIETVYDNVREEVLPVTDELIDLTLKARDQIKHMLDNSSEEKTLNDPVLQETIKGFKKIVSKNRINEVQPVRETYSFSEDMQPSISPNSSNIVTYRIRLKPAENIFLTGTNPVMLLDELQSLGECKAIAHVDAIPQLKDINPESCYTFWDIVLTTDKGIDSIKDVFIFVDDICEISIDVIDCDSEGSFKKLGEILAERGDITEEDLAKVLNEKKYIGEMLVEKGFVTSDKVKSALLEQEQLKKVRENIKSKDESASSIRVPVEKLDILVNLVGELVTVQARLTQTAASSANIEFTSIAEEVERLTAELRDNTLNIRMLPIGTTFGRFKRLVHDLSRELGKEIELTTDGAETELDKTVIEKLNDPLVHLIRNSIDHGIELPDVRVASGKPKTGRIHLSAVHSGANVLLQIEDDGKGLDKEAILSRAIDKGLIASDVDVSDKEIYSLIFTPGFSTAEKVTNVSGRGVGMDVVKKGIDSLRGVVDIVSEKGKGTKVTIKLPLTLAIVEGLLVNIGKDNFVLPLSIVEECVELTDDDVKRSHGRNIANIRGEIVPYIRLRNEFKIAGEIPSIEQIVVTGVNGNRIGFVVDRVIGEHQTVIKNLGKFYKNIEAVSGATILGDGTVALIVDVAKVINNVELNDIVFG